MAGFYLGLFLNFYGAKSEIMCLVALFQVFQPKKKSFQDYIPSHQNRNCGTKKIVFLDVADGMSILSLFFHGQWELEHTGRNLCGSGIGSEFLTGLKND